MDATTRREPGDDPRTDEPVVGGEFHRPVRDTRVVCSRRGRVDIEVCLACPDFRGLTPELDEQVICVDWDRLPAEEPNTVKGTR